MHVGYERITGGSHDRDNEGMRSMAATLSRIVRDPAHVESLHEVPSVPTAIRVEIS